jgi:hypothetical protein
MRALAILPQECSFYMMTRTANCVAIAHYDRMKGAKAVVKAAVAHARDLEEAVTVSAWSGWETNFRTELRGDGGKSVGPLQLQEHVLTADDAVDPDKAVVAWLNLKHRAEVECIQNPQNERLALIASGNCFMGRRKVAHRAKAVSDVLAAIQKREDVVTGQLAHE